MPKAHASWTVHPHGVIQKLEDNLWTVEGSIAGSPIPRVMTLVRMKSGGLIVHSAVALDDAALKEIEAWGRPKILLVPNGAHRLDAPSWKKRYPEMTVVTPAGSRKKVEEVVPVDATSFEGDDSVSFRTLQGMLDREGFLEVRSGASRTLVFNDAIMNLRAISGFGGLVLRLLGFTGKEPKVAPLSKLILVKDKAALKADLEQLAALPGLKRAIVSHGPALDDPATQIRTACTYL